MDYLEFGNKMHVLHEALKISVELDAFGYPSILIPECLQPLAVYITNRLLKMYYGYAVHPSLAKQIEYQLDALVSELVVKEIIYVQQGTWKVNIQKATFLR
jgi:hypothetical protein